MESGVSGVPLWSIATHPRRLRRRRITDVVVEADAENSQDFRIDIVTSEDDESLRREEIPGVSLHRLACIIEGLGLRESLADEVAAFECRFEPGDQRGDAGVLD